MIYKRPTYLESKGSNPFTKTYNYLQSLITREWILLKYPKTYHRKAKIIKFNFNDFIYVKLTEKAKQKYIVEYNEKYSSYNKIDRSYFREDKDGFTQMQFHEFIKKFGNYFTNGGEFRSLQSLLDSMEIKIDLHSD